MSDWKVGDFVLTPVFRDKIIFRIKSFDNDSTNLSVVWCDNRSIQSWIKEEIHVVCRVVLEKPNEMLILALIANGDLDV